MFNRKTCYIMILISVLLLMAGCQQNSTMTPQSNNTSIDNKVGKSSYYTETDISFGADPFVLSGTLTYPNKVSNAPIIILLAGSGPNDRDETIGANKPFKDIAIQLAKKNIATLRFDKRTYTYRKEISKNTNFTIDDEYTTDLEYALEYLVNSSYSDSPIYIAGHSLGGHLIPYFNQKINTDHIKGYIMLSANARPLDTLVLDQYTYLLSLDGELSKKDETTITSIKEQITQLEDIASINDNVMILGAYKAYWNSLLDYDPLASAKSIELPLLIIQGERDYQVTMTDFNMWKEELSNMHNVTLKSFDGLNHLLMYGKEKSTPEEYQLAGSIDSRVINSIVDFVNP